jgi:hypothetical protein
MRQNLTDDERVLNARDDLDGSAAALTDRDIDSEYAFQTLRPGHRDVARARSFGALAAPPRCLTPAAAFARHDLRAQSMVGSKDAEMRCSSFRRLD